MGNKENKWQPIFEDKEGAKILAVVEEIARALHKPPAAWIPREKIAVEPFRIARGASLAHGSSGIALFYAYLSQLLIPDTHYLNEVDRFIDHACDALEEVPMENGLYRGFSGVAWAIQHLHSFFYENESSNPGTDPNINIDRFLIDHCSKQIKFDLWDGCAGLGIYALERYPHGNAKILLEIIVRQLDRLAIHSNKGITWFTSAAIIPPQVRVFYPNGYYALGIAHGIAGVISFLSRVYALGILPDITKSLLTGAISWLLSQEYENDFGLLFPQILLPPENKPLITGTFGWCHGDLGLAAALATAAGCANEPSWKTKGIEAAHAAIDYLDNLLHTMAFSDVTLCHGTAGLGHLFNRLYQDNKIDRFKKEALKWFRHTLDLRKLGKGIAGFSKYSMTEDGEQAEQYDPGFIQGAAGIGLAFLGAVTNIEPGWDRVMSISAPECI
ncbi:MAG TPA: lanthionine synthetase C family protein [Candidatus Deferrimicrobium sp.]|nr:lanthionine synthetase C family protein [Candidatus Kapabacteria bacterium]HLP60941.1 lanthionine synthetase C family protein [Candidatus Deferrimicrobium sp.]